MERWIPRARRTVGRRLTLWRVLGNWLLGALRNAAVVCAGLVCAGLVWAGSIMADERPMAEGDQPQRMQLGLELFRTNVRHVLIHQCLDCHNAESREGGFDLSTRQGLLKGGKRGPVVDRTGAAASRLFQLISYQAQPRMPKDGPRLPESDVRAIAQWIDAGVPYAEPLLLAADAAPRVITDEDRRFWSFQPLAQTRIDPLSATPRSALRSWSQRPIDRFILTRLQQVPIEPAPAADRGRLLRRGMLDLIGLPPSIATQSLFLSDFAPDAWARAVDRMLASPHYGERWGRHWMDVVRFAESYGFEHDLDNPHAFHFRDFVVRAFNNAMPFDQFVRWQIAGDELSPNEALARMATGFLAAGVRNADIAQVRVEQERYDELDDMVATISSAMLGLSLACARCHDHKYDPITQKDYYGFIATFERTIRGEVELVIWPGQPAVTVLVAGEGIKPLARIYNPPPAFYEKTWLLRRGDARLKDHSVAPSVPEVLSHAPNPLVRWMKHDRPVQGSTLRRSALARWMTDVPHGAGALVARVIVNRLWQHHLGRGIVTTPNDFGKRGAPPTHPQLLDWLARELIRGGWDLKHLHRQILCSATWQQGGLGAPRSARDDQLFRGHQVRRLEAEIVRDQMLALSDLFDRRLFGPGTLDEQQPRRSIYFRVKRSQQIPFLGVFDAPDTLQSTPVRVSTTVAPQALAMMNSSTVRRFARSFARRLHRSGHQIPDLVRRAYREALGRPPTPIESTDAIRFLAAQRTEYENTQTVVAAPLAQDEIVLWLDATQIPVPAAEPVPLRRWSGRAKMHEFQSNAEQRPRWERAATPTQRAAVRFGPLPTVMRLPSHESLQFGTGDFSISVLFRLDPRAGEDNHLLGKDSFAGGNSYTGFFFQHLRGRLRFATRDLESGKGPVNYLDSTPMIRKGVWHRATGVRQSGVLSLFLDEADGPDVTRREVAPTDVDHPTDFKIGEMDDSPGGALNGQIAELIVFDRALLAGEVYETHQYLRQKYVSPAAVDSLEMALNDFCQALFCLNEFIYVE